MKINCFRSCALWLCCTMVTVPVFCLPQKSDKQNRKESTSSRIVMTSTTGTHQAGSSNQDERSFKLPSSGWPGSSERQSDIIVFPGQDMKVVQNRDGLTETRKPAVTFTPEPSLVDSCVRDTGGTFCTTVKNYPKTVVNAILKKKLLLNEGFPNDTLPQTIETRFDASVEMPLCQATEEIVYPQLAQSKASDWKFIVQGSEGENMKQAVRVEVCKNAGETCTFGAVENIPNGYTTKCVQKYIYRKLAAIKEDGVAYYDNFKLPSCCVCMYQTTTNLLRSKPTPILAQSVKLRSKS